LFLKIVMLQKITGFEEIWNFTAEFEKRDTNFYNLTAECEKTDKNFSI